MLFDSWFDLLRIAVLGVASYAGLLLLLRVSGKRTLSKLNAFDLVVTVALGSTLATVLLTSSVSLVDGLFVLGLLVRLQPVVAFASSRSRRVEMTEDELRQVARSSGHADLSAVAAVVLEADGTSSVLTDPPRTRDGEAVIACADATTVPGTGLLAPAGRRLAGAGPVGGQLDPGGPMTRSRPWFGRRGPAHVASSSPA